MAVGSITASIISAVISEENKLRTAIIGIVGALAGLVWVQAQAVTYFSAASIRTAMAGLMLIGALCDVGFIYVTRGLTKWAAGLTTFSRILSVMGLNLVLVGFLIGPGILVVRNKSFSGTDIFAESVAIVSLSNLFDALLPSLFVLIALGLLLHLLFWPLIKRPLFQIQAIGIKRRRTILVAVGLALLAASVFDGKFPELLKALIKALGG